VLIDQHTSDIQKYIDARPFSKYQWMIVAMCALIIAFDGVDLAMAGLIAPALREHWGISKADLAPVLTASVAGLMAGALIAGPLGDRIGRKTVLIGSTLCFGVLSIACAYAPTLGWFTVMRLICGVGLGAATPVAVTLVSEYTPMRRRGIALNSLGFAFSVGSVAVGFLASYVVPHDGWRTMLLLGGVPPVILSLLLVRLPESLSFIASRNRAPHRIAAVLQRMYGEPADIALAVPAANALARPRVSSIAAIFGARLRVGTLVLWLTYGLGLLIFYVLSGWLPVLVHTAGLSYSQAARVTAMMPLGSVIGTLVCGVLVDRLPIAKVICVSFVLNGLFLWLVGKCGNDFALLIVLVLLAGVTLSALLSVPVLAAAFYPVECRTTGVSWMYGVGRIGGILGTMLAGMLLGHGWQVNSILSVLSVPAWTIAVALFLAGALFACSRAAESAPADVAPAKSVTDI
jgi:MFS transporter, AAHS family, 4-hydroxybenzoate transporter